MEINDYFERKKKEYEQYMEILQKEMNLFVDNKISELDEYLEIKKQEFTQYEDNIQKLITRLNKLYDSYKKIKKSIRNQGRKRRRNQESEDNNKEENNNNNKRNEKEEENTSKSNGPKKKIRKFKRIKQKNKK